MSVVINEYGIDLLILPSTSPLMRGLVLVYGTTEACISESNKWQNFQLNWLWMTIFNPPTIKIVHIVVFRDSKLCSSVSRYEGRRWWWKYRGCPKRYSCVSTEPNGFAYQTTKILNTVVRSLNLAVQLFSSYKVIAEWSGNWRIDLRIVYVLCCYICRLLSLRIKLEKNCVRLTCKWQKQIGRRVFRDVSSLCDA